jgi:hypothetical protein
MSLKRKKQPKKRAKNCSKIFNLFVGEQVAFLIRGIKGQAAGAILNVTLEGYLLDEDESYLYFGVTPNEVSGAVRKLDVAALFKGGYSISTDTEFQGELQ